MANSIKYSTTGDTQSLKKGNLFFGVGDVGKGPSSVTQHFNGVTPMGGGYTIYFYDPRQPNNIGYDPISSDVQLIRYTNGISGQNFTGATQCFNWYATQTNYTCVNEDYDGIVTSGLTLNLDAGFLPSYGGSGTTWYDLSYSGYNLNLTNAPTYSSDGGGSILFDGVDDMAIGSTITTYTNTQTWTAWVKRTSSVNLFNMFMGRFLPYFAFRSDGLFHFSNQIGGTQRNLYSLQTYSNNVWYFTSFTTEYQNPNTIMKMYINGSLVNSSAFSGTQNNYSINFTVGDGRNTSTWYPFNGYVSMVSVYNRTLSSDEILQNYNAGLARFNTPNIVKSNLLFNLDSSNAVSYPTSGTTWTDLSGNGYTGSLINGPTFNSTSKSIVFDGTNDYFQYSARTPNTEFQYYDAFTVEALAYVNESTSNTGYIITNRSSGRDGNNTAYTGWALLQNNSSILGFIGGYPNSTFSWRNVQVTGTTFTNEVFQKWSHIVWVNTGVAGQQKIYINGVDRTNFTLDNTTPPYTINYSNGTHRLTVGMSPPDGTTNNYNGGIELTRVYNKALSQSEVLQNYYQAPIVTDGLVLALDAGNLVSYSGTGTTWKDLTTNGFNGTLTNGSTFNSANGGSIDFDGTDDWCPVNGISLSNTTYTKIAWFNPDTATNNIISGGSDGEHAFWMAGTNNSLHAGHNGAWSTVSYSPGLMTGQWWCGAVTFNTTTGWKLYLNGQLVDTDPSTTTFAGGNVVRIAAFQVGGNLFNGKIATAHIYNRVLSDDEIAQNYNATKSRFGL
jgi:hypothetical protein